jgi:endoribonuclease LACTB2
VSEFMPGLPAPGKPPEPHLASAVILWRPGPHGRELFWVKRGALRFAGGFRAFPGGRLDECDAAVEVPGHPGLEGALIVCAAREVFEETGVLIARGPALSVEERGAARRALLEGTLEFPAFLASRGLVLDAALLAPAGRWVTPSWFTIRYDAHVFLARMPAGEEAVVWPGELESGEWVAADDALGRWERGEVLLHPPNLWGVQCLARAEPPACLDLLRSPPATEGFITRRVEFLRGLFLVSLRTPTLPPATHTNAWILELGDGGLAVVDPGSPDRDEQARLEQVLADLEGDGLVLREVWLTHAHRDHVLGVCALRERHELVLRAHRHAAARLPPGLGPVCPLEDGDLLGGRYRALHTPGHALGHLAFLDERTLALLAGDMVSTLSTIVIDPPEGDMGDYLHSLERLRDLGPRSLFPAHGPPTQGAKEKLEGYLEHRREREAKVRRALAVPGDLAEVTRRAYDDTPSEFWPVAARSCLASLEKLAKEGKARMEGGLWGSG